MPRTAGPPFKTPPARSGQRPPEIHATLIAVQDQLNKLINPSTARTQYQAWFKREQLAALVGETAH